MKHISIILLACLVAGCITAHPYAKRPNSVTVIAHPASGRVRHIRVTKTELTAQCEALFPGYKSLPSSDSAAGWEVAYEFYFNFGGRSLYVISDGEHWSNGNGDFPVAGNIEQLLKKIKE